MLKSKYYIYWSFCYVFLIFNLGRTILLMITLSLLVACDANPVGKGFVATDITGADFSTSFALTDHTGKARTMADFKGKVVLLFLALPIAPMFVRRQC